MADKPITEIKIPAWVYPIKPKMTDKDKIEMMQIALSYANRATGQALAVIREQGKK